MSARMLIRICAAVASIGSASAQSIDQLNQELAQREATLANLTTSINSSAGSDFSTSKDVEATMKMSVLQKWLAAISTPAYRGRGNETAADGTIAFQGGHYNIWFDQHNNWVESDFSGLNIRASPSQIVLQGKAIITASAEFDFSIEGDNSYQVCQMDPATFPITALLEISSGDGVANYQIDVTQPTTMPATIACQIFRGPYLNLIENLGSAAQKMAPGSFVIGYSGAFTLTPPSPLKPTKIVLSSRDGQVAITDQTIDVGFNVSISSVTK